MENRIIIIGGGIAGMAAASALAGHHAEVILLEKEKEPGGHVRRWDRLFPQLTPAGDILNALSVNGSDRTRIKTETNVSQITRQDKGFIVHCSDGEELAARVLILATGYELFDAIRKEEYGYGIYDNVITSAELEDLFRSGKEILTPSGRTPLRTGFVHCVGSRDEKAGNIYCSKVCCVTGVKQAIELRQAIPSSEIFNFYMDLRMFDRNFEELYFEAQQKWGINFIRGRVSECAENPDHTIVVKTEDTLTGRPLKITVDLLILLIGFIPSSETVRIAGMLGLQAGADRFLISSDGYVKNNSTGIPGVFLAGTLKGPSGIPDTIADARAAAIQALQYLNENPS